MLRPKIKCTIRITDIYKEKRTIRFVVQDISLAGADLQNYSFTIFVPEGDLYDSQQIKKLGYQKLSSLLDEFYNGKAFPGKRFRFDEV